MLEPMVDEQVVSESLKHAEHLMRAGRWIEAESIIRECCPEQADLTLRMAQLEMRRECVEHARRIDTASLSQAQALDMLEQECDYYSAQWVLNDYKGE